MILALDLGGSATKSILRTPAGQFLFPERLPPRRTSEEVGRQAADYLQKHAVEGVDRVVLTGVGSSFLFGDILGCPTQMVDEFEALSQGALAVSGLSEAVVASMGTGTAFLHAKRGAPARHLGGTGVGGGTLLGLGKLLTGCDDISSLCRLAENGSLARVDLRMSDMALSAAATLPPELTAANFGHLSAQATPGDTALGLINLVLQAIGTMAILACQAVGTDRIILTGSLAELPQAPGTWALFKSVYPYDFIVPPQAAFTTAIGAALCLS
ncbi:MAG: pantothenate kinase [Clostridiales bacterium]|nr:pantothenate kinase [Clostridiales bacterium]